MSLRGGIHRYFLIMEKILSRPYASLKDIRMALEAQRFEVSPRTIQRDIEALRDEFGIEIIYDREKNGYRMSGGDARAESAFRFLESATRASLALHAFRGIAELGDYVSFENTGTVRGMNHLETLLKAIREKRKVAFEHENYETGNKKRFTVCPHQIKEYEGRWYLYATVPGIENPLLFGLDRIEGLNTLATVFKEQSPGPIFKRFENLIGVSCADQDTVDVILDFQGLQGKYIRSMPLHFSQEVLEDGPNRLRVRIRVVLNYELKQKILMYGDTVTVVEPRILVKEIAAIHRKSAKKYSLRHDLT